MVVVNMFIAIMNLSWNREGEIVEFFSEKRPKKHEKWPIGIRFFACDLEIDLPTLFIFGYNKMTL